MIPSHLRRAGSFACLITAAGLLTACTRTAIPNDAIVVAPAAPDRLEAPTGFRPGLSTFRPWDSDSDQRLELAHVPTENGWARTRHLNGSDTPSAVVLIGTDDAGQVVILERIDHDERVEVIFDPPLVDFPASLEPGEVFEQTLRMTVHPKGNRSRVRAAGDATSTVELVARETIRTGLGEIDAWRVVHRLSASLNPASVRTHTEQWWRQTDTGFELVAERSEDSTKVLGVPLRQSSSAWVIDQITD